MEGKYFSHRVPFNCQLNVFSKLHDSEFERFSSPIKANSTPNATGIVKFLEYVQNLFFFGKK